MRGDYVDLPITGMTCEVFVRHPGREEPDPPRRVEATVNYATERASVEYDARVVEPERLLDAVEAAGYAATLPGGQGIPESEPGEDDETASVRTRLIVSAVLSLPVLLI